MLQWVEHLFVLITLSHWCSLWSQIYKSWFICHVSICDLRKSETCSLYHPFQFESEDDVYYWPCLGTEMLLTKKFLQIWSVQNNFLKQLKKLDWRFIFISYGLQILHCCLPFDDFALVISELWERYIYLYLICNLRNKCACNGVEMSLHEIESVFLK
jgi:hypothetical protein